MATSFQITIPEPCHADWASMTPETQGRFCAACKKCVVDFTQKAPAEIAAIYTEHGGDVCGRVSVRQLSRPARPHQAHVQQLVATAPASGWNRLRRFAFALLLAFGFFQGAQAQPEPAPVKMGKMMVVPTPVRTLSGTVYDAAGEPAIRATVHLQGDYGKDLVTTTDRKGHFSFTGQWRGEFTLIAEHGDLETGPAYFSFSDHDDPEAGRIQQDLHLLSEERFMMGDVMVEPEEEPQPVFAEALPLVTGEKAALTESQFGFTAYPNPATDHLLLVSDHATRHQARVRVYDPQGQLLEDRIWDVMAGVAHIIDLGRHAAGIYFLQVSTSDSDAMVRRFVKQ
jgi:hypothetical protein